MTGFLLAGVGNVDLRKKSNYLVVDESEHRPFVRMLKEIATDTKYLLPASLSGPADISHSCRDNSQSN